MYNTTTTWIAVHTGMYVAGKEMEVVAARLRDRESKITGGMRAEVMRRRAHEGKIRAATTIRQIVVGKDKDAGTDTGGQPDTDEWTRSGKNTPFSRQSTGRLGREGRYTPDGERILNAGRRTGLGIRGFEDDIERGQRLQSP
jgi:hypothetical protein